MLYQDRAPLMEHQKFLLNGKDKYFSSKKNPLTRPSVHKLNLGSPGSGLRSKGGIWCSIWKLRAPCSQHPPHPRPLVSMVAAPACACAACAGLAPRILLLYCPPVNSRLSCMIPVEITTDSAVLTVTEASMSAGKQCLLVHRASLGYTRHQGVGVPA